MLIPQPSFGPRVANYPLTVSMAFIVHSYGKPMKTTAGVFCGLAAYLFLGCAGCQRPVAVAPKGPPAPVWFEDITERVGLHFIHDAGAIGVDARPHFMPQIMGSGAALFDYDNDGRLDIYLLQNGGPSSTAVNRLFHQEPDGRFRDASRGSGLDVAGYGMGVAVGDVNNDGWPDVFVSEYGQVRLFLNQGDGKSFTNVTRAAGLDNILWATSAAFFDYDRDGWLDLVFVNYVDYDPSRSCSGQGGKPDFCHPSTFRGTVAKLYRNQGSAKGGTVRFEDATLKSGLGQVPGPGLGVVCADFNGDHWTDIFIANDAQANRLWINQRNGTFKEEAILRGIAYDCLGHAQANMGIALGDVDGDGAFDVLVTHLTEETHTLWKQGPTGLFRDQTAAAGLARPRWRGTGFGTVLADFNHDGALDLAVANGRVSRGSAIDGGTSARFWRFYGERNQLFANDGQGGFRDISLDNDPFCGTPAIARGLACGDVDGDGALDLLVTTVAGPARLFRNAVPERGHWLMVRAIEPTLGRDAYGSEITVHAGDRRWLRWINPGYSYLCSNDPRAHFGLGSVDRIDRIAVVWPNGDEEIFPGPAVDRLIELRKGNGRKK